MEDLKHKKKDETEGDYPHNFHARKGKVLPQDSVSFMTTPNKQTSSSRNKIIPSQLSEYDLTENQFSSPSPKRKRTDPDDPFEIQKTESDIISEEKPKKWWQKCTTKPKERVDQCDVSGVKFL